MATTETPPAPPPSSGAEPEVALGSNAPYARVFYPAAGLIAVFVIVALVFQEPFQTFITDGNTAIVNSIGWYYVFIVTGFVFFSFWLAISRVGEIRLGRDDEKPEYSLVSWFAMLFAAGMGIGLVFYGAAEPLSHFGTPPPDAAGGDAEQVAQSALTRTFLHWGVHAWAIYVVMGLGVAYAVHRKGRPVSIRWALEPILGRRVEGWLGDVIDVAAIVGTVFGVATSLGLGVTQVGAGLEFLGVIDVSTTLLIGLIIVITGAATLSVVSGLDKGIKLLSNTNLIMAVVLLLAVLLLGPTLFVMREFVQNIGAYIQNFIGLSFSTLPFYGDDGASWLGSWTTYYWGWWMSWSPFVGVFIARISRGRTVREFTIGVLLVPTLVTMLWFSVLGGTAIYQQLFEGGNLLTDGAPDTNTALFDMLDGLPGGPLLSGIAVLLVVIFFITSSDSGSFVVDMISHGGNPNPPVWSRVFWATLEGVIAAVVLGVAGADVGLSGLQIMSIMVGAPFSLVLIGTCFALAKALTQDHRRLRRAETAVAQRELVAEVQDSLAGADGSSAADGDTAKRRRGTDKLWRGTPGG